MVIAAMAFYVLSIALWYRSGVKDGYRRGRQEVMDDAEWELLRQKVEAGGVVHIYGSHDGQKET